MNEMKFENWISDFDLDLKINANGLQTITLCPLYYECEYPPWYCNTEESCVDFTQTLSSLHWMLPWLLRQERYGHI